jgi:hypothetical protein
MVLCLRLPLEVGRLMLICDAAVVLGRSGRERRFDHALLK